MYKKEDFSRCVINPYSKEFEKISSIKLDPLRKSLEGVGDRDNVIKYIVMIYDPNSPLIKEISDIKQRKVTAASICEIDDDQAEELINFTADVYVEAVSLFLRKYISNLSWAIIQANTETFWEYQSRLMTPIKKDDDSKEKDMISAIHVKSKLSEDLGIIAERIEKHTKLFYQEDEALIEKVKSIQFSPENIANVSKNQ